MTSSTTKKWLPLSLALCFAAIASLFISACKNKASTNETPNETTPETQATDKPEKKEEEEAKVKVLYVTHEPGRYHDYTAQRKIFEQIAKNNDWDLTVMSANHHDMIEKLAASKDFGKDADVIVYNICMADCDNLNVPHNIIQQTEKYGKPAVIIHCALHSFWPTFKEKGEHAVHATGGHKKAHTRKDLLAKWQKEHPNKKFPSWPNFTGFASTHHSPQGVVSCKRILKDHAIFKDVPDYDTNKGAELYYNFIGPKDNKDVLSLLEGKNKHGEAIMLWENKVADSKVICFSLGHSTGEWQQEPFQKIISNIVNYLK